MHPQHICRACKGCAFDNPERCSAYRLATAIYKNERFYRCPDMETFLNYFQSRLADELAITVEDFMADLSARLTRKQFEVLISHVYHGRALRDIATKEKISEQAVRQRLDSALMRARNGWGEEIGKNVHAARKKRKRRRGTSGKKGNG